MAFDYDLITIGAGSGGVRASRVAAQTGARVAIVEKDRIGGTCVIRGCIPKKLMVYASHFAADFEDAAYYGWTLEGARFDWKTLIANKDKEIERLSGIYRRNLVQAGVTIFEGKARFVDANTLDIGGKKYTAGKILIATGGHPVRPANIGGIEHAIVSDDAFDLTALPEHVTLVGGGYIALEFAGIFHGLGAKVTLLHRGDHLLRGFDADISAKLLEALIAQGIDVRLNTDIAHIEARGQGKQVRTKQGQQFDTGLVMLAVGRDPNIAGLGLEHLGISQGANGAVIVDERLRSSVPSVFAIGDVIHRLQLTPIAIREGQQFAEREFGGNPQDFSYANVATAVFSQPPIGTVGLTEAEALAQFGAVDIYMTSFRPLKHTLTGKPDKTVMKLVVDVKSEVVLGCHILGEDAAEMIQCVAIAVGLGATKRDFDRTVAVHPTAAEELVTLKSKVRRQRV